MLVSNIYLKLHFKNENNRFFLITESSPEVRQYYYGRMSHAVYGWVKKIRQRIPALVDFLVIS